METIDREVAERATHGDADAFTEIYAIYAKRMYRYAYLSLQNEKDAEDAVSDAVLDAWREVRQVKEPEAFAGWFFQILRSKCLAKRKLYAVSKEQLTEELPEKASEGQEAERVEARLDLREALSLVSDEERQILLLNVDCGFSLREVAGMLSQNEATIRSKKSRALTKLRTYLEG